MQEEFVEILAENDLSWLPKSGITSIFDIRKFAIR